MIDPKVCGRWYGRWEEYFIFVYPIRSDQIRWSLNSSMVCGRWWLCTVLSAQLLLLADCPNRIVFAPRRHLIDNVRTAKLPSSLLSRYACLIGSDNKLWNTHTCTHTHTHTAGAAMRGRTQAFSGGERWRSHSTCATSISADIELNVQLDAARI